MGKTNIVIGMCAALFAACGQEPVIEASAAEVAASLPEAVIEAPAEPAEPTAEELQAEQEAQVEAAFAKAAETSGPGEPALWKLSDQDSTIYLFGTVHILRPSTDWLSDTVQGAFDNAQMLVMETDVQTPSGYAQIARLTRHYGMFAKGTSLLDYAKDGEEEALEKVAAELDVPLEDLTMFKPWLLTDYVTGEQTGPNEFERSFGVEEVLSRKAVKAGMSFGYLESADDQFSVLSRGSIRDQLDNLLLVYEARNEHPDHLDALVAEWADGDVEGLGGIVAQPGLWGDEAYYEAILVNRNRNWIPKIKLLLGIPGETFVAVGAAHLAGPDSVIEMLRAKGYKVTRIDS